MGFIVGKVQSVWQTVNVSIPADDGGHAKRKADFAIKLKVADSDLTAHRKAELVEVLAQFKNEQFKAQADHQYTPELTADEFEAFNSGEKYLLEDIEDVKGILDAEGNGIPFSEDVLQQLLNDRRARQAMFDVWKALNFDEPERVKQKN